MARGTFDLEDYASQLKQITKMGSLEGILGMLPGVAKVKDQLAGANLDHRRAEAPGGDHIVHDQAQGAASTPDLIKASRKKRIAAGSGATVQEVNRLLKQFDDMSNHDEADEQAGPEGADAAEECPH